MRDSKGLRCFLAHKTHLRPLDIFDSKRLGSSHPVDVLCRCLKRAKKVKIDKGPFMQDESDQISFDCWQNNTIARGR